jgi:RNA polymerase sigma-70 factor (ECF subfamily)
MDTQTLRETYATQLRMYIASRVQGPAADDILQQVFLKVHQKLDSLQEPKALKSRLYRTTQHTIIDRYRKEYGSKE